MVEPENGAAGEGTGRVAAVPGPPQGPGPGAAPAFGRWDMGITPFWREAPAAEQAAQRDWHRELASRGDVTFGDDVFVSRLAVVYPDRLVLGERTYVSAHTYFWGDVETGADCTVNPFSELRGLVRVGDGVRIGAHTSVLGFNHEASVDRPVHEQPLTFRGITIEDDVWIGSHVVVLDGVRVGSHSIIGAGAVVTKDVPAWSVVGGNPARRLRDRRTTGAGSTTDGLRRLADVAREEAPQLLTRAWSAREDSFVDHPGADPTVRAWCDAVELAHLLGALDRLPVPAERCAQDLRGRQDPRTGLVPERSEALASPSVDGHAAVNYHVLSAGYALDLLGTSFEHPVVAVADLPSARLRAELEALPWGTEGWRAGARVDSLGTAMLWNRQVFGQDTELEALIGWLVTRCHPATGLWGVPDATSGWLEPVNGFYRLTRGTFAQFGVPLPYPDRTVDSVLAHAADDRWFGPRRGTACNVLDVIHPLWLAAKQTGHRREEGEQWARAQLERVTRSWQPGAGLSFALEVGDGWQRAPGLLGTEMWLAITWLLADHLGVSDVLGYHPRGIHRPEPAVPRVPTAVRTAS